MSNRLTITYIPRISFRMTVGFATWAWSDCALSEESCGLDLKPNNALPHCPFPEVWDLTDTNSKVFWKHSQTKHAQKTKLYQIPQVFRPRAQAYKNSAACLKFLEIGHVNLHKRQRLGTWINSKATEAWLVDTSGILEDLSSNPTSPFWSQMLVATKKWHLSSHTSSGFFYWGTDCLRPPALVQMPSENDKTSIFDPPLSISSSHIDDLSYKKMLKKVVQSCIECQGLRIGYPQLVKPRTCLI